MNDLLVPLRNLLPFWPILYPNIGILADMAIKARVAAEPEQIVNLAATWEKIQSFGTSGVSFSDKKFKDFAAEVWRELLPQRTFVMEYDMYSKVFEMLFQG
jgi:hypothetical protein